MPTKFTEIERALDRRSRSRAMRSVARKIRKAQDRLRRMVPPDAWRVYLDLESLAGRREDALVRTAIRLARRHGQRGLLLALVRRMPLD